MVGRPSRREGLNAVEAELGEIKPLDEDVDRADRIIVADTRPRPVSRAHGVH
jgi:hypothetical protein